jgi:hypothetical protein
MARQSSSSTAPAWVSRTPSRRRYSNAVPMISSRRRICWLSVGRAMYIRSAACVNVPASATAGEPTTEGRPSVDGRPSIPDFASL